MSETTNLVNKSRLSITFCGAARTVTGSMYYLEYTPDNGRIYRFVLDAGMFQVGEDVSLYKMNSNLLFEPKLLDAMVLTHCHLDHCGRIPILVNHGFGGRIHSTPATRELAEIVLLDAAKQQEPDQRDKQLHLDALGIRNEDLDPNLNTDWYIPKNPEMMHKLYDQHDVEMSISRFKTHEYHQEFELFPNLFIEFRDAGHILGSANVVISEKQDGQVVKQMIFSGDLGNPNKPIIRDPEMHKDLHKLTHVVVESTYGDRLHPTLQPKLRLKEIVKKTFQKRGKLLIPSFSVERAQEVIYYLSELMRDNEIPQMPIFLDSPMASKVLDVCLGHPELYDELLREKIRQHAHPLLYKQLRVLNSIEESKSINGKPGSYILIAGSGMLNGGRILKHLLHNGSYSENTLLFVGYQAQGTLGREILDLWKSGQTPNVNVDGYDMEIKAEIAVINEFSAHADQAMTKRWIADMVFNREKFDRYQDLTVFITHGEHSASETLARELKAQHPEDLSPYYPRFGERVVVWE
jgi:metallo-beta-lactamase family protein